MSYRALVKCGVEIRDFAPGHGGDILRNVALCAEECSCLVGSLEIDFQAQSCRVTHADSKPIERLASRVCLDVPDRRQRVPNRYLFNFSHWGVAELWEDMELQGAEPATGYAFIFQIRLA